MKDGEIKDEEIKGLEKKEITAFDSVEYREDSGKRQIRSYVLRSKKPADSQMDLVNSCFDKYSLGFEKKYIDRQKKDPIDYDKVFASRNDRI